MLRVMTGPQVFALCWGLFAVAMGLGFVKFAHQHADLQVRIQKFLRVRRPSSHNTIFVFTRVFGALFAVIGVIVGSLALAGRLT